MMYRVSGIIILILLLSTASPAQDAFRGTPYIKNFSRSDYSAGTQNWGICQDQRGFMFFANNNGLLYFNGVKWNLSRVSSSSPPRSIFVDSKNRLFIGLINDFGIITLDEHKEASFKSLKCLLPDEYKEFDDIWRIHESGSGIVFQCQKYIFIYSGNKIEVIKPHNRFHFSFKLGDKIIIQEIGLGVHELVGDTLVKLSWWQDNSDVEISTMLELDESKVLIGTTYNGVFILEKGKTGRWNTPVNRLLTSSRLYTAALLPDNKLAFGTILDGLIISDRDGEIYYRLNTDWGIQNNTVLSLFVDKSQNLWLGLDNGIDFVEINSPISYIGSNKIGTGYCCRVFDGKLYLGTNQGLYVKPFNSRTATADFVLVENTAGQVWTLEEVDGQLLCGHSQGIFVIADNTATQISKQPGVWKIISLKDAPEKLIAGHYQGLAILKKSNMQWQFKKNIEGFNESSRYLYQDKDGNLWVGHSGKGIFKMNIDYDSGVVADLSQFTSEDGLPSDVGNILFMFEDEIFASTDQGIYKFNKDSQSFRSNDRINKIFSTSGKLKTISRNSDGDSWFIADKELGVIRKNDNDSLSKITIPLSKLTNKHVNEFEFIYPSDKIVFIGLEDGFAFYTSSYPKTYRKSYRSFITKIELPYLDSVLYQTFRNETEEYRFPFRKNSFRFHFAAPFFENEDPLLFSYFLEGFSEKWSHWTGDTYKDFTTLHEGEYILKLKSKNIYGTESEMVTFSFKVTPPWRRSVPAYIGYLILFAAFIYLLLKYTLYRLRLSMVEQQERHNQELKDREDMFHREALISEKEILDLRNEKLRTEMVFRDKELANQTMAIIEKNKFLIRVNEDLHSIQDYIIKETARLKINSLKKRIKKEIDIEHQNKIFETYFDEAHNEFFKLLKEKHPDLTPYDLRLCAFIRMNISTKEIATMLNISYRGAEVSRYRLRKKMELPREVNLSSYLAGF